MKKFTIFFLMIVMGCSGISPRKLSPIQGTVAIAPFEHPTLPSYVLSGYLVKDSGKIDKEVLSRLTHILLKEVSSKKTVRIIGPNFVSQCKELVIYKENRVFLDPVKKWSEIGKCIPADFVLVPQLFVFKPRIGGTWGAYEPAKIMFSLNLIDVKNCKLIRSHIYREKQLSLSDNLLNIKQFIKRKGKWVSAYELATEGIKESLKEIGL